MSNAVWPILHGLSWKLKRRTKFKNAIQPAVASGYETRLQIGGPDPVIGLELEYVILYAGPGGQGKDELSQLDAFFQDRKGSHESFLIDVGLITKNPAESSIIDQELTIDVNGNAPLVRTKPATQSVEAIYELQINSEDGSTILPIVKLDDVVLTEGTDYTLYTPAQVAAGALNGGGITYGGYVIHFLSSPWPTGRISADFGWLYRVRFAQDEQEYDMFHFLAWDCNSVQLVGTRT